MSHIDERVEDITHRRQEIQQGLKQGDLSREDAILELNKYDEMLSDEGSNAMFREYYQSDNPGANVMELVNEVINIDGQELDTSKVDMKDMFGDKAETVEEIINFVKTEWLRMAKEEGIEST